MCNDERDDVEEHNKREAKWQVHKPNNWSFGIEYNAIFLSTKNKIN